jgi:hypothetical protein
MPKHVHLPPILPYLPVAPLEKKERARRKAKVGIDQDGTSETKTEEAASAQKAPSPAENPVHSTNPLASGSGALGVLLNAQEDAQPADAVTRRPDGQSDDEDV